MKKILLSGLFFISIACFAAKTDSLFQRHQFSFSLTNGVSAVLVNEDYFGGYDGATATAYYPYTKPSQILLFDAPFHHLSYTPAYSVHLKCNYSFGVSKLIRLETGVGYLIQSMQIKYSLKYGSWTMNSDTRYSYGGLSIPVHIKFQKALRKGRFTCTLGPDFTFPLHEFYTTSNVYLDGLSQPSRSGHEYFSPKYIVRNYFIGLDLKMGYEKQINNRLSIDIGPVFNVINAFNYTYFKFNEKMPNLLQAYAGIDVAVNFGMKK